VLTENILAVLGQDDKCKKTFEINDLNGAPANMKTITVISLKSMCNFDQLSLPILVHSRGILL